MSKTINTGYQPPEFKNKITLKLSANESLSAMDDLDEQLGSLGAEFVSRYPSHHALQNLIGPFGIADVEMLCPSVSRDTIRLVMNRWRKQDKLEMLAKGRDAKWQRTNIK